MARFDVYPNPNSDGYLLDVQSDLLSDLNTRIVVPLLPLESSPQPANRLNPVFQIGGSPFMMATQFMASVPSSILGKPAAHFGGAADEITNAMDMVFVGF